MWWWAKVWDICILMNCFLGVFWVQFLLIVYENCYCVDLFWQQIVEVNLINYVEIYLAGVIGVVFVKIIIGFIVKEDFISLEEMFKVLE